MKKYKILSLILALICLLFSFSACDDKEKNGDEGTLEAKDFAAELKLDMTSGTCKQQVTVKNYVDGDTTHFNVPTTIAEDGVLKARYLAINTPESTGRIEEYGKKASHFTEEKLRAATSILIESDDGNWNLDSTGSRYLVWVWYKTSEDADWRNLNVEILQNGLAIASNSGNNRYGETCLAAIAQAKAQKLSIHSGEKDPDFYYGEAVELTLRELRSNVTAYEGVKVAFEGVLTRNHGGSVYVESFDEDSGRYYGIQVYYQTAGLTGDGLEILKVGNLVRIVGTVQYYATGDIWQVSGLTYRAMKPNDPGNIQKISEGHSAAYSLIDAKTLMTGKVTLLVSVVNEETKELEEVQKEFDFADLARNTTVRMENLKVTRAYTTADGNSKGAMTLTCEVDGVTVTVRTERLYDTEGNLVTEDAYVGKTIHVRGMVDSYSGEYQIRVFAAEDITIL